MNHNSNNRGNRKSALQWPDFQIGRIFRWLGLPWRTFLGIGIASWWLDSAAELLKLGIQDWFNFDVDKEVIWKNYLSSFIVFLIPFVVVLLVWLRYKPKEGQKSSNAELRPPEGKKGLILLVSNPNHALFAIKYHLGKGNLERVWLIPSNGTNTNEFGIDSFPQAQTIKKNCETLYPKLSVTIAPLGVSPGDSQDTFDAVNRLFRESGYEPHELIADFTGGTKPMAVGMIMACLPSERELEYVSFGGGKSHGPFVIDYQYKAFGLLG